MTTVDRIHCMYMYMNSYTHKIQSVNEYRIAPFTPPHHHMPHPPQYPSHSLPTFHSCVMQQGSLTFRQRPPTSKEELKSSSCYLLAYKDQVRVLS